MRASARAPASRFVPYDSPMLFPSRSILARAIAALLVAATALAPQNLALAQVNLPELGDADTESLSPAVERRIGERAVQEMRRTGQIYDDPEIGEYLALLGGELAAAGSVAAAEAGVAAADFTFFSVQDASINAFALPGGFIGVNTGLISAAQTESELASVIGHEIGHVTQRHIARMLGQQKVSSLAILGAIAAAILAARSNSSSSGDLAQAAILFGQAGAVQQQLNFSRDAEREADRVGFQTLVRAGFEPQAMGDFFARLQKASRLYESNAPAYMRTHPLTVERIADMQNRARGERYKQRVDRFEFHLVRARVRALADGSVAGLRETKAGFDAQLANAAPGRNLVTAAGYYGLAVVQLQQRDFAGAERSLAQVRARGEPDAFVEKLAAEVQIGLGEARAAVATLDAARKRWNTSGLLRAAYAQALQAAGRHADAVVYLREQTALYRGDPHLFELLAQSHAALGQQAREHQALAEVYRLRGSIPAAVDQLEIAQRLTPTNAANEDFMLASEVTARLRELRSQMRDELRERGGQDGQGQPAAPRPDRARGARRGGQRGTGAYPLFP